MAKAAAKRKTSAKKTARKAAAVAAPVKKKAAVKKAAVKKAAPQKAAPKKAAPKTAVAKRPVGRPSAKKAVAPAKRPVGRPPSKKAAAAKAPAKRSVGRPAAKKAAAVAKRPVGRPPAKKAAAAPAKRAVGRPPARKAAVAKTAARRTRVAAPASRPQARAGIQTFNVSHLNEADFKADGLRPYALYRDLGIAAATSGLCQAHVIRLVPPCTDEVRKRHLHQTELQLIYVLKGWIKNEFEGHGVQMMSAGTCWLQPPGIAHTVLDYSADCEMLEIIVPADFKTVELA